MHIPLPAFWLAIITVLLSARATSLAVKIVVSAGDFARSGTVVTFPLPVQAGEAGALRDASGRTIPLQVDAEGGAAFILDALDRGGICEFTIVPPPTGEPPSSVEVHTDGSVLRITAGGKPVVQYQMDASEVPSPDVPAHFRHGAHLHPITSPGGRVVTGNYPADHRWHRGIWLAWTKTDFANRHPDFWNMGKEKTGELTGEVRFRALEAMWSGAVHGGFRSRHQFIDHTGDGPQAVLDEQWTVTVHAAGQGTPAYRSFDLVSVQQCAGDVPLKLPRYYYGGLGYRGHPDWEQKGNFSVLTSEGETDRAKSNQQLMRWIHCGGKTGGQPAGIAILCHPSNFRAPQPVRVNPTHPQICFAPSELGDWEITPGKPYVSRYRFVVADGPPDARLLDRLWNDYAHPPTVTVQ